MLEFKNIEIEDKEIIEKYTYDTNYFMCSYCFGDIFMWRRKYKTRYCIKNDFLYMAITEPIEKKMIYLCPIGRGEIKKALCEIKKDSIEKGNEFIIKAVPERIKEKIEETMWGRFEFTENRDSEDYIYLAENMINLKGKKLHSKRNFVNRFRKMYEGRWKYEEMNEDNIKELFEFQLKWCEMNQREEDSDFLEETCAISQALRSAKKLGLKGGMIKLDGNIIAISLGSMAANDMFVVHIEKAVSDIAGAYQMINQQFAEHNCGDVMYIDREEDLGIEGLRKAKLSYYPIKMGVNYTMRESEKILI